jgi:predicted MarR family transcription regulator
MISNLTRNKLIKILTFLLKVDDIEIIKYALESLIEELKEGKKHDNDKQ